MSSYNSHILHAPNQDPFKMALFKLMGRIDPQRRSIPLVTATTEDWMWFQLAMVQSLYIVASISTYTIA
jgi:nuclear pore complex protein Nup93